MKQVDIIIIGAGHNGLSLGVYLSTIGLEVLVLERRAEFGGGLCTEEVTVPGFAHNIHSNFHGTIPFFPPFIDFELEKRGVTYLHPSANTGMPLSDGRALVLYADELRTYEELARFSKADANYWLELRGQMFSHLEEIVGSGYSPPIDDPGAEAFLAEEFSRWFGQDVASLSAYDFVCSRFSNPHIQALILFHMTVGGWDVREPKLAPLGIAFLGYITNWQLCRGGSHHLAHVLGTLLLERGGDLKELAPVERINLNDNRACGVTLADGTKIGARQAVVSTVDAHQTFLTMLEPEDLDPKIRASIEDIDYGHGDVLFGVHLALKEAPKYTAAAFNPDINTTFNINIGYERPEDIIEHYEEIDAGKLPFNPRLQVGVNTLFDPSLAPAGHHTALLWQFVPYEPDGNCPSTWEEKKADYAERCIEAWRQYAPNITADVILGTYAHSPFDTSQKLINMRRGGFHCASVTENQAVYRRPAPAIAGMTSPIDGLFMAGSAVHPHGGITAGPAYNCFQVMVEKLGLSHGGLIGNKFWEPVRDRWRNDLRKKGFQI